MLDEDFARGMGVRLRDARLDRDMNQTRLGRCVEASQSSVGYWETGKRGIPLDKVVPLCKALRITPGYLFGAEPIDAPQRVAREYSRLQLRIIELEGAIRKWDES